MRGSKGGGLDVIASLLGSIVLARAVGFVRLVVVAGIVVVGLRDFVVDRQADRNLPGNWR
jgi:hypothetical protein